MNVGGTWYEGEGGREEWRTREGGDDVGEEEREGMMWGGREGGDDVGEEEREGMMWAREEVKVVQ